MTVKFLYGLPAMLQTRNGEVGVPSLLFDNLRVKFESCDRIDIPSALVAISSGDTLDSRDIMVETMFSTNESLAKALDTLRSIEFIGRRDRIDIYEFAQTDDKRVDNYVPLDMDFLIQTTGLRNLNHQRYQVVCDTIQTKLKSYKGKTLKSKSWNTAGEILDDDYETVKIKREKPLEPLRFTQLLDVVREIKDIISDEDYLEIFKRCAKVQTGHFMSEDGDSWRDYSYYTATMIDIEKALDETGHLLPYLRKRKLLALQEVLAN